MSLLSLGFLALYMCSHSMNALERAVDCRTDIRSVRVIRHANQVEYVERERVGFIIREDLDMRKLSAKWVPKCLNADQKRQRCQSSEQHLELFWRDPNDFLSRLVTMDDTCYITMTRRQSNNQWSCGIAAHPTPKNSECKNLVENFSSRFFGIKTASSSLIIFQRAKLSTQSITYLCWCNWRSFWRRNAAGRSPRGSCSCTTMPGSRSTCNPEETGLPGLPPYSPDFHSFIYYAFC